MKLNSATFTQRSSCAQLLLNIVKNRNSGDAIINNYLLPIVCDFLVVDRVGSIRYIAAQILIISIGINKKTHLVHCLSYIVHNNIDEIPREKDGHHLVVRHLCANTRCFRSDHLKLGTYSQNMYDDKILHNTLQNGEKAPNATISEELAIKIKISKLDKKHPDYKTQKQRAVQFGVGKGLINNIDRNQTWSHLPDINGIIEDTTEIRKKNRETRKKAEVKIWTPEMFKTAEKKLMESSKESDDIQNSVTTK